MLNDPATFTNQLLENACNQNASDIHFLPKPNELSVQVFLRCLGTRQYIQTIPIALYQNIITFFKFSANMDIGQTRQPQNGRLQFKSKTKKSYALRLSTLPLVESESLTIRILPQDSFPKSNQLFLFPKQFERMQNWFKQKSGIILFVGPTGCGKTTTMYALLESVLKNQTFQAITLEDPVERQINDVIQVEINEKSGMSYASGLKAALRHDPDVIMVGEIRDKVTAKFAFEAALTGHLVISTLHAKDAVGTIARLLDLGIKQIDIEQSLIAISGIQLLPLSTYHTKQKHRAAIADILDGLELKEALTRQNIDLSLINMNLLRERAYIYGFISEETFETYQRHL